MREEGTVDPDREDDAATKDEEVLTPSLIDTKTRLLDDILIEKLEQAFHKETSQVVFHELAKIATESDPIDLAHAITRLPSSVRYIVYENLPDEQAKRIFMINASLNTRTAIFRHITDEEIQKLVEKMPPDEAVSVLDDLPDRRRSRVLELLDKKKALRIRELQKHGRDTAGRLMTNEFFSFPMRTTIGQVAAQIRDNPGIEITRTIFVLNDAHELVGYVPARNLIVNPANVPIQQIMRPVIHKILPEASRDEVVEMVERYKTPTLPVVDAENHLLGVLTYEDVLEAMEDIAAKTIASIGGTSEEATEAAEPLVKRFFWRAPWLIITLLAGLATSTGLTYFHDQLWFAVVPFFVPLITGMSGNVGIQCSTLLVRAMATGEISSASQSEVVRREIAVGLFIGIVFALLCGVLVFLLSTFVPHHLAVSPHVVATIVSAGVFGACFTATCLGTLSPIIFAHYRIDPAVASGPIVTACNDVLSTFMYILLAKVVSTFVH